MLENGGPLLLVLDDIWSDNQVERLLGSGTRLPPGGQLLLTSRCRQVVASYNPLRMEMMPDACALKLLAWSARRQTSLPEHLAEVALDAVRACGGLPLGVKVLGSMLRRVATVQTEWQVRPWRRPMSVDMPSCFALLLVGCTFLGTPSASVFARLASSDRAQAHCTAQGNPYNL